MLFRSTVTVHWQTADGTATTANNDYIAASGTATFAPGVTSTTATADAAEDVHESAHSGAGGHAHLHGGPDELTAHAGGHDPHAHAALDERPRGAAAQRQAGAHRRSPALNGTRASGCSSA